MKLVQLTYVAAIAKHGSLSNAPELYSRELSEATAAVPDPAFEDCRIRANRWDALVKTNFQALAKGLEFAERKLPANGINFPSRYQDGQVWRFKLPPITKGMDDIPKPERFP